MLITHEMHAIRKVAEQVAVMEKGQVVEQGNVVNIFNNPQKEITKRFVNEDSNVNADDLNSTVNNLIKEYPNGIIVKLTFNGDKAQKPIISQLLRKFNSVDISILEGSIHQIQGGSIGSLIIHLQSKNAEEQQAALNYLKSLKIETEVISHE